MSELSDQLIDAAMSAEVAKKERSFLTPPLRLSSYDDGEENAAHPHMMICRLRRNACIEERCQKGKEDLSQASFKYMHFAVAGKSSYEDERRSLRHHHMMISDAEGLNRNSRMAQEKEKDRDEGE